MINEVNRKPRKIEAKNWNGHEIEWNLHPGRRNIAVSVNRAGHIRVRTALTTPWRAVEDFLAKQRNWLETSLLKASNWQNLNPAKQFSQGEKFFFLGQPMTLSLFIKEAATKRPSVAFSPQSIQVFLPEALTEVERRATVQRALIKAYRNHGQDYILERVQLLTERLPMQASRISLRGQRSIWGSCSPNRQINLNWKLIFAPKEVIDYVIIHEFVHIEHPNHSKNFWSRVGQFDPLYRSHRKWLRDNQHESDFLHIKT